MRVSWLRNRIRLLILWVTIIVLSPLAMFLFTVMSVTVQAEDGEEITSKDSANHIQYYGDLFDATVTIYPDKLIVGPVHFMVTLFKAGTTSVVKGARVQLTVTSPTMDAFKAWAVADPAFPGKYHTNLSLNEPGNWTAHLAINGEGIGDSVLKFSLIIGDRPLGVGTLGTLVWLSIISAFVIGSVYLWSHSRSLNR